jgi:tetratricopeptide (TPR) repeat protein
MEKKARWAPLALVLAIIAAYGNSLHNGFHFDDFHTVYDNPAIRSLHNVPRFFTDASTFSVLPTNRTYRPIVSTTLAIDYALGKAFSGDGYALPWFHVGTICLFLVLVLTIFGLNRRILSAQPTQGSQSSHTWVALLAAAWFGLHPAMAETVNYVIQRGDLYCTLGAVLALFVYARWPLLRRTGLYLLPYTFALLSKPPAAVFPLLLLLYIYFFEADALPQSTRIRRSVVASLPSIVVTAALLALQGAMTPKSFVPSIVSPWLYRLTQPYVWLRYSMTLFLPLHLNVDTDLEVFTGFHLRALAGLFYLVVLVIIILCAARRRRLYPIAYGLLWFVITQLPTSLYPLSEVENDHRMFFSFVGLTLAVVWAAWLAIDRMVPLEQRTHLPLVLAVVCVLMLCAYGFGVVQRNRVWHDEDSLWLDDVQKSPHNGRGLMIYGLSLMGRGQYNAALDYFERALPLTPNYPTLEINLGVVNGAIADQLTGSAAASHTLEAQRHFERAIALAPATDEPHAYYGRWLLQHGRLNEARNELQQAVQLNAERLLQRDLLINTEEQQGDLAAAQQLARATLAIAPDDSAARAALQVHPGAASSMTATQWINLSLLQYQQASYDASIVSAQNALQLDPHSAEAWNNIGAAHGAMLQWDTAILDEQQALRLNPNLTIAQNNLRWFTQQRAITSRPHSALDYLNESLALNRAGNYAGSLAAAQHAVAIDPRMAEAWNNIAAAEAAMHRWDEAIAAAQKAIVLKPDFQLAKNNLAWAQSQKAAGGH